MKLIQIYNLCLIDGVKLINDHIKTKKHQMLLAI